MRDALRQRIDVAVGAVEPRHLARDPILRQTSRRPYQIAEDARQQARMRFRQRLAKIGHLADLPQEPDRRLPLRQRRDLRIARQGAQRQMVVGFARAHQLRIVGPPFQAGQERAGRAEVERRVAPLQGFQRREAVLLDGLHHLGLEGSEIAGDAEAAIAQMTPRPPRDLRQFRRQEPPHPPAVELRPPREEDMLQVHVEAHADGVGGDQEVHLAGLEHADLRVARARRQRTHDHGRAAAPPAHELGDGVDVLDREGHHRAARRQAREFLDSRVAQGGKPRARDDLDSRHQTADQAADRVRADEHGLLAPAHVEQPVGEDVAALAIGRKLDLVDGQEIRLALGHGLDGAQKITRLGRLDALFAGDERDRARAFQRHHLVVVLARQQTQGKAHHAGAVRQHPLDRHVGLAGVGRPQDRGYPRVRVGGGHDAILTRRARGGKNARRHIGRNRYLPDALALGTIS